MSGGTVTYVINASYPPGAKLEIEFISHGHANIRIDSINGEAILNEDGLIKLGQAISQMHGGDGDLKVTQS